MGIRTVFYDPTFAKYTPTKLWIGTGMRAVDHAVECFYHPNASEMPWKALSFWALSILFECLPKSLSNPDDEEVTTKQQLAAFASAGFVAKMSKGAWDCLIVWAMLWVVRMEFLVSHPSRTQFHLKFWDYEVSFAMQSSFK
jgi:hypothetical protein